LALSTAEVILQIITEDPGLDNEAVASEVQRRVPGSTTSAASVSSTKSRLKKDGLLPSPVDAASRPAPATALDLPDETTEERSARIRKRYATLERMAHRVADGHLASLIVSGPPGLGKSYTVERVLREERDFEDYRIMSGTISAVGLYIELYRKRAGGVVVLDDCDDVFRDETCLNILKAVLDTSETRLVSYMKRAHWMEEEDIPSQFEFEGTVVFCTNLDFEAAIRKGSSMAPHFEALMDRSLYLSLTMRTQEDFLTRLHHVGIEDGLLVAKGLDEEQAAEVMAFVRKNASNFYGLSIRLLLQIAYCYVDDPEHWKFDIEATKMRTI
jgi:hypothetical protein